MSVVAIIETIAWLLSAVIAAWIVLDVVRVGRRYDEATLVNAPDPLEGGPADTGAVAAATPPGGDGTGR
ncbi:hypothetical protein H7X46_20165 [Pseudonocardia sp. C8]|uniref:hypothetical protein n=1 Tax=Pseudonocardia sp. C8 TaxID=2762759 RepID=UPI001642C0D8|nr:hypothetical protein [Pseudonocardia sp. C8]MBC3193380.1 hypothetical protein [Pseudonocardia sp. C8]